jgi:tape measure domain-containing protein
VANEDYVIAIRQVGAEKVARDIEGIGKSAKSSNVILAQFRSALVALSAFRAATGFVDFIDAAQRMSNSIKVATRSTEEYAQANKFLRDISNRTRTDLEANATVYSRLLRSTEGLGFTTEDLEKTMEGLALSIKVGGATSMEARNSLVQFSQALASGALRGDELRSVAEQLPALANAIGKEFGMTGGQLIAFAKANPGILETDRVIRGVIAGVEDLRKQFAVMAPTIGEGFIVMRNKFMEMIQDFEGSTGILSGVALGLIAIAQSMKLIVSIAIAAAFAYATAAIQKFAASVIMANNVLLRYVASGRLIIATQTAINAVMRANPLGVFITVAAVAVGLLIKLYQNSEIFRTIINGLATAIGTTITAISTIVGKISEAIGKFVDWQKVTEVVGVAVGILATAFGVILLGALSGVLVVIAAVVKGLAALGVVEQKTSDEVTKLALDTVDATAKMLNFADSSGDSSNKLGGLNETIKNYRDEALKAAGITDKNSDSLSKNGKAADDAADAYVRLDSAIYSGSQGVSMIDGSFDSASESASKAAKNTDLLNKSYWDTGIAATDAFEAVESVNGALDTLLGIDGQVANGLNGIASGYAGVASAANAAAAASARATTAAAAATSGGNAHSMTSVGSVIAGAGKPFSKVIDAATGQVEARAKGGPVTAGQTYLVGENGPELFEPSQSGTVTNSKATANAIKAVEDVQAKMDQFWKEIRGLGGIIAGPNVSRLFFLQRDLQDAKYNLQYAQKQDALASQVAEAKRMRKEFKNGFGDDGAIDMPGFENVGAAPKIDFQTLTPMQGGKDYGSHDPYGISNAKSSVSRSSGAGGAQNVMNDNSDNRITVQMTVVAQDAQSFRQNQATIDNQMLAAVERAQRRRLRR